MSVSRPVFCPYPGQCLANVSAAINMRIGRASQAPIAAIRAMRGIG